MNKNAFEEMKEQLKKEILKVIKYGQKELLSENNFLTVEQVRAKLKVTRATLNQLA